MTGAGNHPERCVRDRVLELAGDAERRTRVLFPQIRRVGTAMRGSRSRWSAGPSPTAASGGSNGGRRRPSPRAGDELGARSAGEETRDGGIELLRGRCQHPTRDRQPSAHLCSGSDPFHPAYVSLRISVATSADVPATPSEEGIGPSGYDNCARARRRGGRKVSVTDHLRRTRSRTPSASTREVCRSHPRARSRSWPAWTRG